MNTIETVAPAVAPVLSAEELEGIKGRQRVTWASGDYSLIGTTLQIVGESLCEAVDLRAGSKVLDVAAGNGNCSLAAARRFAEVTSTDYVPELLEDGRRRAEGDRLPIVFQQADAEALPFRDESFDVVLSSFGVMFTPNHSLAAHELVRVCRRGGRIGLTNWTPRGFIGRLFAVVSHYVQPPKGLTPASRWGMEDHLDYLFRASVSEIHTTHRDFVFRYRSPQHWIEVFKTWYGPVHKAFGSLSVEEQARLEHDLIRLIKEFNSSGDSTMVVPAEYLEVVIVKK